MLQNGCKSIGSKLADITQKFESLKHIQNAFTQVHSQHSNTTQALNQRNPK